MIYDFEEEPDTADDLKIAQDEARLYLRSNLKRCAWALAMFVLSCVIVFPFMAGEPLHNHWEPLAKYLVYLCMGLWLFLVIRVGFVWSAWKYWHDISKDLKVLLVKQN